ncbi:MAG: DNA helicase RecG [Candidatus Magasanikbacteria bacterium CG_4_9_14_3_um_filter_32_9]|uniref:ATP-dependent DNA helicase RecG n=1 Tax=Candidatus Magasanikbacteria bacterium CG_4_9_14_3_um_filter_32_9 TaxID=1974644 RepID=A0A2M7Z6B9_9BACT|nr:MAG: DNA helicase RecG [Candidatus Magasanikbacteria bacterium CG_4_9_14_3_um_filter_32_9]
MNITLETPIQSLNKVGEQLSKKFEKLGIKNVRDLLFHFPFRYEDYSKIVEIKDVKVDETITVKAKVELIKNKMSKRKHTFLTEALISDDSGRMRVLWFKQPFIAKTINVGDEVYFSGTPTLDRLGILFVGPIYEKASEEQTKHTARIIPIYSSTYGLTQKQIRFFVGQIIKLAKNLEEWVPEEIFGKLNLFDYGKVVENIHFPENNESLINAKERLTFDELFMLQLRAKFIRNQNKALQAPKILFKEKEIKEFVKSLPFELTEDQRVVTWEILKDLQKDGPMNRMLQGDVGSGKTVVAAIAGYNTILNNHQVVILAPTEILAKQHFNSFQKFLRYESTVLFTRTNRILKNNEGEQILSKAKIIKLIQDGEVNIIIGTHALLGDKVSFKKLGLIIIDEQHRFGVEQRKTLKEKSGLGDRMPHFLTMSATPIPRSLALVICGDLDISTIRQMPSGRKPVKSRVVSEQNRNKAYDFIHKQVEIGRQVFVICPLIENKEGEGDEKKSVLDEYDRLSKKVFPDLKIGYLHGKLKAGEKDETMKKFADGKLDILVSTSVIEVGVDIPNATVMMIENADRFGLAQLHQFRGRVGRSSHQSFCFIFTDSKSEKTWERLDFFEKNIDGLKISEFDLQTRGPGQVYGKIQSGNLDFKFASISDTRLFNLSRSLVEEMEIFNYPTLVEKLIEWERGIHLE